MNVLITGACGFVGHFLTEELLKAGHSVCGFDLTAENAPPGMFRCMTGSITDAAVVAAAVAQTRPDACIHLAGIASPPVGRLYPERMLNTNILGTAHILEALHTTAPACRFLLASTAYVYGNPKTDVPIHESTALRPNGIYAVSKAAADLMTLAYAQDYQMHTMTARAANHTGPGQSTDFVVPAFAKQIASIAAGRLEPCIRVGNLDSERSFMDVRDVVRAYRLLIEKGQAGKAYNVSSPGRVPIRRILETLAGIANVTPRIEVDQDRFRKTDMTPLLDTSLIAKDTGWNQIFELRDTLREVLHAAIP
jgi:GDP-4-dehydro-6-deoxy-D-mannose reductase